MMKRYFFALVAAVILFTGFGPSTAQAASTADRVIATGKAQLGTPYRWGGTTPYGFDCSGFVQYAFASAGISLPRTAANQYGTGTYVSRSNLQPGDIVFFATVNSGPSHNGIYIGNNQFIHSSSSYGVTITSLSNTYWSPRYLGARRVIQEESAIHTATTSAITVVLNGRKLTFDQEPVIENSRTLVPMRAIFEAMNATVEWDPNQRIAYGYRNGTSVAMKIGESTAYVNNQPLQLDSPAIILGSRTLVPLRFISESLGAKVEWDHNTRTVTITD